MPAPPDAYTEFLSQLIDADGDADALNLIEKNTESLVPELYDKLLTLTEKFSNHNALTKKASHLAQLLKPALSRNLLRRWLNLNDPNKKNKKVEEWLYFLINNDAVVEFYRLVRDEEHQFDQQILLQGWSTLTRKVIERFLNFDNPSDCIAFADYAHNFLQEKWSLELVDFQNRIESEMHAIAFCVWGELHFTNGNMAEAIKCYTKSLEVLNVENKIEEWSKACMNLAIAYMQLPGDNRPNNIEIAIEILQSMVANIEPGNCSEHWAEAMLNLGWIYGDRIYGERESNINLGIIACTNALTTFTKESNSVQWANIQVNLGNIYRHKTSPNHAANQDLSIYHSEAALTVFTKENFGYMWSGVTNNLGNIYRERINGQHADNIEQALLCYQDSLSALDPSIHHHEWSMRQFNIGVAYSFREYGPKSSNLNKAITALERSLLGRTQEGYPYEWAATKYRLGLVYQKSFADSDDIKQLNHAIAAFEDSLAVFKKEVAPAEWARSNFELGKLYSISSVGDKVELTKKAIMAFKNALQVFTRENDSQEYVLASKKLSVLLQVLNSLEESPEVDDKHFLFVRKLFSVFNDDAVRKLAEHNKELVNPELHQLLLDMQDDIRDDANTVEKLKSLEDILLPYICNNSVHWLFDNHSLISAKDANFLLFYWTDKSTLRTWKNEEYNSDPAEQQKIIESKRIVIKLLLSKLFEQSIDDEIHAWINHAAYFLIDPDTLRFCPIAATAITNINQAIAYYRWGTLLYNNRQLRGELKCISAAVHCYQRALEFVTQHKNGEHWADLQLEMGKALNSYTLETKSDKSEEAAFALRNSLQVFKKETKPERWARCQYHLAISFIQNQNIENEHKLESAIGLLFEAREYFENSDDDILEDIYYQLANIYLRRSIGLKKDNEKQAAQFLTMALEICEAASRIPESVKIREKMVSLYMNTEGIKDSLKFAKALELLQQLAIIYKRFDDVEGWAGTQLNMSTIYNNMPGNNEKALECALNALSIYTAEHNLQNWARTHYNLGTAYLLNKDDASNRAKAIVSFELFLQVYGKPSNEESLNAHINLLNLYLSNNDEVVHKIERYIPFCLEQIAFYEQSGNYTEDWADMQCRLAAIYLHQSMHLKHGNRHFTVTKEALEKAIDYYETNSIVIKKAQAQFNLGTLFSTLCEGNVSPYEESALHCYAEAANVYNQEQNEFDWAMLQQNIGGLMMDRRAGNRIENIEKAIEAFNNAINVFKPDLYALQRASCLLSLASAFHIRASGDFIENQEKSIDLLQEALQLSSFDNSPFTWACIQNNLGNAYTDRIEGDSAENIERAITAYEKSSLVKRKDTMPLEWALCQNNLGNAYKSRIEGNRSQNLEKAIEYFENALTEFNYDNSPIETGRTYYNLGIAYGQRLEGDTISNVERSIEYFARAFEFRSLERFPYEWALTKHALGEALLEHIDIDKNFILKAITSFEYAIEIFTPEAFPMECSRTALRLGIIKYVLENYSDAIEILQIAHQALENWRERASSQTSKIEVSKHSKEIYSVLVDCYLKTGQNDKAFEHVSAAKGRTLSDILTSQQPEMKQRLAGKPDLLKEWDQIELIWREIEKIYLELQGTESKNINESGVDQTYFYHLRQHLTQLQQSRREKLETFFKKNPLLSYVDNIPPISPAEARNLAYKLNTTIIEYFNSFSGWIAFTVSASAIHCFRLPPETNNLIAECCNWIDLFKTGAPANRGKLRASKILKQCYINLIEPVKSLLTTPSLLIAPSQDLHNIPFGLAIDEQGQHLFELYEIRFIASTSVANAIHRDFKLKNMMQAENSNRALVIGHSGYEPYKLQFTTRETDAVTASFSYYKLLREDQATAKQVIAAAMEQSYQVLHFSCHGGFNYSEPEYSGLLLNGYLTIEQIVNELRLTGAPLVVISACETARAEIQSGDEITSFNYAFLQAGAAAVVSSLWPVNDKSTMHLFESFYRNRKKCSNDTCKALRLAMKETQSITEYDAAFYWGAFQVYGLPEMS